jgi:hypothetical protein
MNVVFLIEFTHSEVAESGHPGKGERVREIFDKLEFLLTLTAYKVESLGERHMSSHEYDRKGHHFVKNFDDHSC